jgi:hypothetical protein
MKYFAILLLCFPLCAIGQQGKNEIHFTPYCGVSSAKGLATIGDARNNTQKAGPVFGFNLDYALNPAASIGIGASYQNGRTHIQDYVYAGSNNILDSANVDIQIQRFNIGFRAAVHYLNNAKLDLYSGFNANFRFISGKVTTEVPNYDLNFYDLPVNFQVIVIGMKTTLIPRLMLNAELAWHSPYLACIGLSYRLNK